MKATGKPLVNHWNWTSALLTALLFSGCGPKTIVVEVPPRIDLQSYNAIGVVDFTSDPTDKLNQFATQKFMSVVQRSQPNVRFLELGSMDQLLTSVGRERIDPETVKIVGKKHNVETIFTGAYEISDVKPQVRFGQDLSSVSAAATVRISLTLKQWDAKTGVTLWTNSRNGQWSVANVETGTGRALSFSVSDPRDKYAGFMEQLVNAVADDFRPHYERRAVTEK